MNTDQALAILPFVGVLSREGNGRPRILAVPAKAKFDDGRRGPPRCCRVTLDRVKGDGRQTLDTLVCSCRSFALNAGDADDASEPCIGMAEGHLCYHAIAAAIAATSESGKLYFYEDHGKAAAFASARGGRVFFLASEYGSSAGKVGQALCVFIPKAQASRPNAAAAGEPIARPDATTGKGQSAIIRNLSAGRCGCGADLVTPDQRESGLCGQCDRSTASPAVVKPLPSVVSPLPSSLFGGQEVAVKSRKRK